MAKTARVIVSLTDETAAALRRAATASGKTIGGLAGELLEEARPVFEGIAGVMGKAKDQRMEAMADLEKMLSSTAAQAGQLGLDIGDLRRAAVKVDATVATMKKKKKAHRGKST